MSLFKLKNLWAQTYQEEFDHLHLSLHSSRANTTLALGSFSGTLRVFHLQPQVTLIYENTFESPIVATEFVEHPQEGKQNTIGILLFRKLIYLHLVRNQNGSFTGKQLSINTEPAFALCRSPVSVLTLNSSVQYLNPLSLEQIKVSDPVYAFYRKQQDLYYSDGEELVYYRNSVEQWRVILGPIRQIEDYDGVVVVLGENAIWEVEETKILKTKVFDDEVSCGCLVKKSDSEYNILIGNMQAQILVYDRYYTLLWAVKMEEVPLKIIVVNQSPLRGALCILGDQGTLSLSYLGSDLPETSIEPLKDEIQIESVDGQIHRYLSEIKAKSGEESQEEAVINNNQMVVDDKIGAEISIKSKPPKVYSSASLDEEKYLQRNGKFWSCEIQCIVTPEKQPIFNVKTEISMPSNLSCLTPEQSFSSIRGRQVIIFTLLCSNEKFPYDDEVSITLKYDHTDKKKATIVTSRKVTLPLDFQINLKSLELEDKPSNKIVMKAASQLPPFCKLFHELGREIGGSKNLTLELANGVLCSVGYNKNCTKIKVESNFFSGLCFMFIAYWHRLQQYTEKNRMKNEMTVDIPLEEFFGIMKDHHEQRLKVRSKFEEVEKKSEQFRSIQKKLLTKMKEKVSSVNHIDKLLEYAYRILMESADSYEQAREEMEIVNHNLEVSIKFVTELLFMKSGASQACRDKVMGLMGYEKESWSFGWEEKVMSSSSFYLGKKFHYENDSYTFDQVYKIVLWVISEINSGKWN